MMIENGSLLWWQSGVIYQIYPRSFQDTDGDGIGDLQGIVERLDYLNDGTPNSLGVDAIWISPFYPSPMKDFGYDVSDYCDVDPMFGDLATFDRLLAAAHERNIKVIIDWVPNHTSDQHPWFIESRRSRDNSKRDWYIWRDPKPDGSPPNNWGSTFGGPAWTLDEVTGQYYLHQFVREQPELNWRNPEVKAAMYDTLRFWLDRGVDGFRMDVIAMIIKDDLFRDNPPNPNASADLPENDLKSRLLDIYNMDREEVHDVLKEIRQLFEEYHDRVTIGELWGPLEPWVRYYGEQGDELHMPFNFRLMDEGRWDAQRMQNLVDAMEAVLPDFAWPNYVLGNHDRIRLATRFGGQAQARTAALMLLTLRGTPTLYYGDEIGLENGDIKPEQMQDPQGINLGVERTRDVTRTPMQWDAREQAGFSTVEPWLPISADYAERNVVVQSADSTSILNLYRKLLWYRRGSAVLQGGRYRALNLHDDCFVYLRATAEARCLIALNFVNGAVELDISEVSNGRIVISTHLDREEEVGRVLRLRPFEGILIELSE
jgi:alpha-glucosidase